VFRGGQGDLGAGVNECPHRGAGTTSGDRRRRWSPGSSERLLPSDPGDHAPCLCEVLSIGVLAGPPTAVSAALPSVKDGVDPHLLADRGTSPGVRAPERARRAWRV